jgi:ComF family protein
LKDLRLKIVNTLSPLIHLFYPHICLGCSTDILEEDHPICLMCLSQLPHTEFALYAENPVEKLFWGRLQLNGAFSEFYFNKGNVIQSLIHELKYKGNKSIGLYLGRIMAGSLKQSNRFRNIDALVPLPLFSDKEKRRGYNQSLLICEGVSGVMNIPIITDNVIRERATETQTKKKRKERWQNVEDSFKVKRPGELENKHILLIDDVLTTGATLDACASEILKVPGITLSIATLAYASS